MNSQGYATYSPLPDASARSIIPLNDNILYPKEVAAYVTCCQAHANSLMTPLFAGSTVTPMNPVPSHRPSLLLHSAHVRQHLEIESPSDARRHAIIWSSSRRPLIFSFNEVICPCCPHHAQQLHVIHRDTFSAYNDEIEEMNSRPMQTIVRTETPTPEEYNDSLTLATTAQSLTLESSTYTQRTSHSPVSSTSFVMIPPSIPSSAPVSTPRPCPPALSPSPSNSSQFAALESSQRPRPQTSRPPSPTQPHAPRPMTTTRINEPRPQHATQSYVSVTNRAPIPVPTHPRSVRPTVPARSLRPKIEAMTTSLPQYVLDPTRVPYVLNFEAIASTLRLQMLLCLHVLDYPNPSNDVIAAARSLIVSDLQVDYNLTSTIGNYTVATYYLTEHLQDHHTHAIRSSSDSLLDQLIYDPPNCGILRCIFYYREGPHVDATAYLDTFNPLNCYHMILTRLNATVQATTPRLKVTVAQTHPSAKCYRLPSHHFDVDLQSRDPSSLSEIPPPMRHSRYQSSVSSRSSSHSLVRSSPRPQAP
jgi:hypothetical protein